MIAVLLSRVSFSGPGRPCSPWPSIIRCKPAAFALHCAVTRCCSSHRTVLNAATVCRFGATYCQLTSPWPTDGHHYSFGLGRCHTNSLFFAAVHSSSECTVPRVLNTVILMPAVTQVLPFLCAGSRVHDALGLPPLAPSHFLLDFECPLCLALSPSSTARHHSGS